MDLETSVKATRRRGLALEDALLEAAWDQLVFEGYGSFTVETVAVRAATSKPVIYRRWRGREELVVAALRHFIARHGPADDPDTGTLRGDMIALLAHANESRLTMAAVMSVQLAAYYEETGTSPAELRELIVPNRTAVMETVIARAVDRGEVVAANLTPRTIAVPFDLFRQEALMTLKPVPHESIVEIVDDIFLPLVSRGLDHP